MQTGAEEEETWKDLKAWGYDDQLNKVETETSDKVEPSKEA